VAPEYCKSKGVVVFRQLSILPSSLTSGLRLLYSHTDHGWIPFTSKKSCRTHESLEPYSFKSQNLSTEKRSLFGARKIAIGGLRSISYPFCLMTMTKAHRLRPAALIFAAAMAGSIILLSSMDHENAASSFRRHHRRLMGLTQFADPKSVTLKSDAPGTLTLTLRLESQTDEMPALHRETELVDGGVGAAPPREKFMPVDHESRRNCQIVYITGVEGATHHGFVPVIAALARNQVDPDTGLEYAVDVEPRALKAGLFGWNYKSKIRKWGFKETPDVDDPAFVQRVVQECCPNDGRKHVLIEWASFPSGHQDDRRSYRVRRSHEWLTMSPEEIANTDEALSHPTNMNAFYRSYSPYVDIKFVVLHRPFLETIASHRNWDGGPITHSNIIRGFMLMLRRFLDTHLFDLVNGRRLWSLVCVDRIMSKNYETENNAIVARQHILSYLASFLDWPEGECPHCFDNWIESAKDPLEVLGEENVMALVEHTPFLEGVWPPPGEVGIPEQQCGI
jgi:hypothetical protein